MKKDVLYGRNKPARKELNSEPSDRVETDLHLCSRKS